MTKTFSIEVTELGASILNAALSGLVLAFFIAL